MHQDKLCDFWANANIEEQGNEPFGITSTVGDVLVAITPTTISETFQMNYLAGKTFFPKKEFQLDLIERGYDGQLNKATMFKPNFPPPMKFLFHTILTCLLNKTTSFNEIPLKIQYSGYAILNKLDFNYSQALFTDMVNNVKNVKNGKNVAFSFVSKIFKLLPATEASQKAFEQGTTFKMNSLSSETFTHLRAKESNVSKTQAKRSEQILDESTSVSQTSVTEPTTHGYHNTITTTMKPPPSKPKKTKS
ncbi:hypothetical protein Hanom_Chr10g00916491 [Helianthus anomalus]